MKTRLVAVLSLVAAFAVSATASPRSPVEHDPFGFNVSEIIQPNDQSITRGTPRMTVRRLMGPAYEALSPDVWLYHGYHPNIAPGHERGCDTLVISFADDQVTDLKIVNARATAVIADYLKLRSAAVQVARK